MHAVCEIIYNPIEGRNVLDLILSDTRWSMHRFAFPLFILVFMC